MVGFTEHFELAKLGPGDNFSFNSYEFSLADRDTIDRTLYQGSTSHRHNGTVTSVPSPTQPLSAVLDVFGGSLAPNTTFYWEYTYTDTAGNESGPSPLASLTTPAQVTIPATPNSSVSSTGGSLTPGQYFYAISAYQGDSPHETLASVLAIIAIPNGTNTNKVTLNLGTLPTGATGYNIYRRTSGGSGVFFIDSTTSTSYVDTGTLPNCDRTLPTTNSTGSQNEAVLCLPGATPTVPPGYTWSLYRTSRAGDWSNSLVQRGIATPCYTDTGTATLASQPPTATLTFKQPDKVLLTDAGEVQGRLPPGLTVFPFEAVLHTHGTVALGTLLDSWVCEYPVAIIRGCRVSADGPPAAQQIIVDINKNHAGATPTWASIYASQGNRPKLGVGFYVGVPTVPDDTSLVQGDQLTLDVDQAGGAATPTDKDLHVTIFGWAYFTTMTSSTVPPWF